MSASIDVCTSSVSAVRRPSTSVVATAVLWVLVAPFHVGAVIQQPCAVPVTVPAAAAATAHTVAFGGLRCQQVAPLVDEHVTGAVADVHVD